ncbi:antitoxin VbhA family protein [Xanthomonas euvesicatoria pv. physalidis]|uniref:antitoxin VbhA family protein n=1 Tax=Xanthomonas euvesicatoria TaxID=456327 RepID=UPI001C45FF2E|nr:antitoxin VbhA family protein [Xanthomonas euvesicatoria]MBV6687063.1 antitoxin VbhA family protein [Xanthomonas euvesicatoria pv. physalidis]
MTAHKISEQEKRERANQVQHAKDSLALTGDKVSARTEKLAQLFIEGEIDANELENLIEGGTVH